jgi:hypothetical protein
VPPPWEIKERIVKRKCPGVDANTLKLIFVELKERAAKQCRDSIRDILSLAQYAQAPEQRDRQSAPKGG